MDLWGVGRRGLAFGLDLRIRFHDVPCLRKPSRHLDPFLGWNRGGRMGVVTRVGLGVDGADSTGLGGLGIRRQNPRQRSLDVQRRGARVRDLQSLLGWGPKNVA